MSDCVTHPKLQDSTGKFLRINPEELRPVLEAMEVGSFRYVCSALVRRHEENLFETYYQSRSIDDAIVVLAEGHNCMILEGDNQ